MLRKESPSLLTFALPLLLSLACCQGTPPRDHMTAAEELAGWMSGIFSSKLQAAVDPENYFEIRLVMVPIWTEREDGTWLYVEQALESTPERPYRQRVYRVYDVEQGIRSDVYELPGVALDYAGVWTKERPLEGVAPEELSLREGCSIFLARTPDGNFEGATEGEGCTSSLGEAAYATSEVFVAPDRLESWDRGWSASGEQAWGATEGAYVFDLVERLPRP